MGRDPGSAMRWLAHLRPGTHWVEGCALQPASLLCLFGATQAIFIHSESSRVTQVRAVSKLADPDILALLKDILSMTEH